MTQEILQEALNQISERRQLARLENDRRYAEIIQEIPEISEINRQMAQTASTLLSGKVNVEAVRRQNLQAQQYCSQLLVNHGYPKDYLDIHYVCEKCQDTGYCENEYCSCLKKMVSSISTERINRISELELCDFSHFSLSYYRDVKLKYIDEYRQEQEIDCYDEMEKVFHYCQKYAANFKLDSPSLLFYGRSGVGKTHLSLSIVTEVLAKGYEVIYDSVGNLLSHIESEHFQKEKSENFFFRMALETDLLVLDDLGTEFQNNFSESIIYQLINTRLNKHLPTIISANLGNKNLATMYDPRIVSRLFATYKPLHFFGKDIRKLKQEQNVENSD